jgi:hypothetical protein
MAWPEHYPPDCPPASAEAVERSFYRLVSNDPPSEIDLRSNWQKFPAKQWGNSLCKACGLSIFSSKEDALKTRQRIPAFRDSLLAVASVAPSSGAYTLHLGKHQATIHGGLMLNIRKPVTC